MRRTLLGRVMVGVGAALVVVGAVGQLRSGGETAVASPTTTAAAAPTSSAPVAEPSSTTTSTTTEGSTTTTSAPTTTTTTAEVETVEEFVAAFAAATASDDAGFLFQRLHPVVLEVYDPELCRGWVEREIVGLEDYRLVGEVTETVRSFDTPSGPVTVDPVYLAEVAFVFQGQPFQASGLYAPLEGEMRWFGECR